MCARRLNLLLVTMAILLTSCAGATPTATRVPTATNVPTAAPTATTLIPATTAATGTAAATDKPAATVVAAGPFAHTDCATGTDLIGQTLYLYHLVDASSQRDEFFTPLQDGLEDAATYFNAHGGVCGALLAQVFPDPNKPYNAQAEYTRLAALNPKPLMIALYGSGDAELLRDQLAKDQIPALGLRVGSLPGLYSNNGQTPSWTFATNPSYPDQFGAFCQFVSQHPQQYPNPVIGYLSWDDIGGPAAYKLEAIAYCASLGVKVVGTAVYFSASANYIHAQVQTLIDGGANILYTDSLGTGPALIAKTLVEMNLQDKVALAAYNWGLDPSVGRLGQATLGAGGLPSTNGLLGSLPLRAWSETDQPGIQLITEQADLNQRPQSVRNNFYILAWASTDLYIELYIQTGNRVGFDHITGGEMKKTLENIVYSPLGGLETIDFQKGARRSLSADRIGQMAYLGQDGKTPAGPSNPILLVNEGGQQLAVPLLVPQSDFQLAPDLRPGSADLPAMPVVIHTGPLSITGQLLFGSNRSGNDEIYRMNANGSGLINLTNNPAMDWAPALSPDGAKIAFSSERDGNSEVYVMNVDGSGQTRLTNNLADDGGPLSWSPDGKKIVFKTNRDGNYQIYEMNANGSGETNLSNTQTNDELSALSPDGNQIVFASDGGIYVMNSDGSHTTRLTTNAGWFPSWSPDGKKIAFESHRDDSNGDIYVLNADGGGETRLTDNPASDGQPAWLPDGKHISFESDRDGDPAIYVMNADGSGQTLMLNSGSSDGIRAIWLPGVAAASTTATGRIAYAENTDGTTDNYQEIWIINADGGSKTRLTKNDYYDAEPAWSPDGEQLAFASARDGQNDIFVMDADGSGLINLTNKAGDAGHPAWSPDGQRIAYSSVRDGDEEIYVMNADGSGQTRLTHNAGIDNFPSFSPDGKRLAFGSVQGGVMGVYLMNADGSGQTLLTPVEDHTDGNGYPAWSPNGQQIAFATTTGGSLEIYVIGVDGSGLTRLTNNPADDYMPVWSPDGSAIAFTSERDGSPQVYEMNADSSEQTRLTDSLNGAVWPSWTQ